MDDYLRKEKDGYFSEWIEVDPSETPFGLEEATINNVSQETLNNKEIK